MLNGLISFCHSIIKFLPLEEVELENVNNTLFFKKVGGLVDIYKLFAKHVDILMVLLGFYWKELKSADDDYYL